MSANSCSSSELPPTYVEGFHDLAAVRRMTYKPLGGTGMIVSSLGFGASAIASVYGETESVHRCILRAYLAANPRDEESIRTVRYLLKSGVNILDTAPWYGFGKGETVLGQALEGVPRRAYYLNTKVGRYLPKKLEQFDFTYDRTIASVEESCQRLGVEYLDVVQVHDPEFAPGHRVIVEHTLPALEHCQRRGLCRFIGITGYPLEVQREIILLAAEKGISVHTSIVYCHNALHDTSLLSGTFLEFAAARKVGVIAASPLAMGLLTPAGPPAWHPASEKLKEAARKAAQLCEENQVDLIRIALWYSLIECSHEHIASTLLSCATVGQARDNLDLVTRLRPLAESELRCLKICREEIFQPLEEEGLSTWYGVEVGSYWKSVGRQLMLQLKYSQRPESSSSVEEEVEEEEKQGQMSSRPADSS